MRMSRISKSGIHKHANKCLIFAGNCNVNCLLLRYAAHITPYSIHPHQQKRSRVKQRFKPSGPFFVAMQNHEFLFCGSAPLGKVTFCRSQQTTEFPRHPAKNSQQKKERLVHVASSVWEKLFISKVWTNYVVIMSYLLIYSQIYVNPSFSTNSQVASDTYNGDFQRAQGCYWEAKKTMKYIYISHGINFMVWVAYLFVAVIHISNGSWILVPDDFATTKNNQEEVSLLKWRFFTFHLWMFLLLGQRHQDFPKEQNVANKVTVPKTTRDPYFQPLPSC